MLQIYTITSEISNTACASYHRTALTLRSVCLSCSCVVLRS